MTSRTCTSPTRRHPAAAAAGTVLRTAVTPSGTPSVAPSGSPSDGSGTSGTSTIPNIPTTADGTFAALLERAVEEILVVTYWFEPAPQPGPYPITIRFTGRRIDMEGPLQPSDRFIQEETIERVVPGSGPIAVTTRVHGVHPGAWAVNAQVQGLRGTARGRRERMQAPLVASPALPGRAQTHYPLLPRLWHRWAPVTGHSLEAAEPVQTCVAPFARVPGILIGVWAVLVGLGMAVALAVQSWVLARDQLAVGPALPATLGAIAIGIVGAKVWYIVKHRRSHRLEGWCIQGFIAGASGAALLLFLVLHMPTGIVLDATAPGLLLGLAVGRVGCFFGGCCGGPPTASRWGVWSSDQRVGARRIPTQLLESGASLLLGLAALMAVLGRGPADGTLFVAVWTAYILLREGILRLRVEPYTTHMRRLGGWVTPALAALMLVAAVLLFVFLPRQ